MIASKTNVHHIVAFVFRRNIKFLILYTNKTKYILVSSGHPSPAIFVALSGSGWVTGQSLRNIQKIVSSVRGIEKESNRTHSSSSTVRPIQFSMYPSILSRVFPRPGNFTHIVSALGISIIYKIGALIG